MNVEHIVSFTASGTDSGEIELTPRLLERVIRCKDCLFATPVDGLTHVFTCEYLSELVDDYGYCHHGDEDRGMNK
jgi:hypothetical protein